MGAKKITAEQTALPTSFKYGMPVYGLLWPEGDTFYICGGGGHGIKNRLVCAEVKGDRLTDQVGQFLFEDDCPNRLALAPNGKSLVLCMSKGGIRRLELDVRTKNPKLTEVTGMLQERLASTRGLQVNCLSFSSGGDLLALGCEDGTLMVYEWPGMEPKLELTGERKRPKAISDMDFSRSERSHTLAMVLDGGTCELWDVAAAKQLCRAELARGQFKSDKVMQLSADSRLVLQHLPRGMEGAVFKRVQWSRDGSGRLYALMNHREGAFASVWRQDDDGMLALQSHIKCASSAAPCMDSAQDGSKLALGTAEGEVVVVSCTPKLSVVRRRPKAHMVFCTACALSADGGRVLSASGDASVTVTECRAAPKAPIAWVRVYLFCVIVITIIMLCLKQYVKVAERHWGLTPAQAYDLLATRLGLGPQGLGWGPGPADTREL